MSSPKVHTTTWNDAPALISRLAGTLLSDSPRVIVGVTGPAGSGKTTLAERLSPHIVSTDDYLPDYELVAEHERDLPEFADLERLAADLAELRAGKPTRIPQWSFHTHRREGERLLLPPPPGSLLIVEGIHALYHTLHPTLDLRVYVDAPRDTRWSRVEARERTGERGWGVDVARAFFHNHAEPTFAARADEYRNSAQVIVQNH